MKLKLFFTTLLLLLTTFIFKNINSIQVFASENYQKHVIFINQVRGSECCDKGSLENLEMQINAFKDNELSATFVVRYDALANSNYSDILRELPKSQFEVGGFLEITPELAKASEVKYLGDEQDWYQAQNSYTIGYQFDDREKIIDTYMEKFFEVFSYYPKTTTAWIMDTRSINYMKEKYGVRVHQITREQWGTDSYTMSGGPVHYPYYASKNWVFLSSQSEPEDDDLLIMRQTGSDPLLNYGDTSSAFTTQPNDYSIDGKKINYFYKLKDQLLNQKHNDYGFLLLGLENSMDPIFQEEFLNQIKSVAVQDDIVVSTAKIFYEENSSLIKNSKMTAVYGVNLIGNSNNQVVWINSKNYRVRLLMNDKNIYITDLRVFNQSLVDPYNSYIAQNLGFWVVPFIFDGSRFYVDRNTVSSIEKTFDRTLIDKLKNKFLPEFQENNFEMKESSPDFLTRSDSLGLSTKNDSPILLRRNSPESISLIFEDQGGEKVEINFLTEGFDLFGGNEKDFQVINNFSSFLKVDSSLNKIDFFKDDDVFLGLNRKCEDSKCSFTFDQPSNQLFVDLRKKYYPFLFPELIDREVSNQLSIFYAHNKFAVAGKNPVRFVFIPKDEQGFFIDYPGETRVSVDPDVDEISIYPQQANGTTFVDIIEDDAGLYKVNFKINDKINKQEVIYFAPNCKEDIKYCLFHPKEASWYLKSILITKLRNF